MNYYLDTEFIEGKQKKRFFNISYGESKNTIELISVGLVSGDGRRYYAISKDFNLREAWNRWQSKKHDLAMGVVKEYWIRDNVLTQIFWDLYTRDNTPSETSEVTSLTYRTCKKLLNKYGKTNEQISKEIKEFVYNQDSKDKYEGTYKSKPVFHAYYADYDWVVFCWLFGKMINLPEGFPMYCVDLKQIFDEKLKIKSNLRFGQIHSKLFEGNFFPKKEYSLKERIKIIKQLPNYPVNKNDHNALSDALWCKDFHKFLMEEC